MRKVLTEVSHLSDILMSQKPEFTLGTQTYSHLKK